MNANSGDLQPPLASVEEQRPLVSPQVESHTFVIPALDCPEEYILIDKGLAGLRGIQSTAPDYLGRALRVEFDPAAINVDAISGRLALIGFPARVAARLENDSLPVADLDLPIRWTTVAAGALLVAAGGLYFASIPRSITVTVLLASIVLSGFHVFRAAFRAVRLLAIDMNVLMTIAAVGAVVTGEFFEAGTAMFLFAVSLWLESYTLSRARRAVRTLVQLTPTVAHRLCRPSTQGHAHSHAHGPDDQHHCHHADHHDIEDIHPNQVEAGDLLLVRPGERIPVDGMVAAGESSANQGPITGESVPVEKGPGDQVFAGSLNGEGTLELRATKTAADSTLAHVARLVDQAQASRSPTERFVDRFARYYTPIVVGLALLLAFVPPLLSAAGLHWFAEIRTSEWLHRGLVLLVIACPCALVISTPVTILCGLHQATRFGLIVKGGDFLERAGKIRCIAFDKTGTLTEGKPRLVQVRPMPGIDADHVLRIAAALESASEHPLAHAITSAIVERGWSPTRATQVTTTRGAGVEGVVDGQSYFIGNPRYVLKKVACPDLPPELPEGESGETIAVLGTGHRLLGALYLADQPRSDAEAAIRELRASGIEAIVMLTGDSQATAERIGARLGIDRTYGELLPQDKVERVRQLVADYGEVAMVGDGVNDAPALAASRLGIALGLNASDTALETADVVCLSPHLTRVPQLVALGRQTRSVLAQNIAFALSIKIGVLILAAIGLGTLWAAVIADVGASMLVTFNGMRILRPVTLSTSDGSATQPALA